MKHIKIGLLLLGMVVAAGTLQAGEEKRTAENISKRHQDLKDHVRKIVATDIMLLFPILDNLGLGEGVIEVNPDQLADATLIINTLLEAGAPFNASIVLGRIAKATNPASVAAIKILQEKINAAFGITPALIQTAQVQQARGTLSGALRAVGDNLNLLKDLLNKLGLVQSCVPFSASQIAAAQAIFDYYTSADIVSLSNLPLAGQVLHRLEFDPAQRGNAAYMEQQLTLLVEKLKRGELPVVQAQPITTAPITVQAPTTTTAPTMVSAPVVTPATATTSADISTPAPAVAARVSASRAQIRRPQARRAPVRRASAAKGRNQVRRAPARRVSQPVRKNQARTPVRRAPVRRAQPQARRTATHAKGSQQKRRPQATVRRQQPARRPTPVQRGKKQVRPAAARRGQKTPQRKTSATRAKVGRLAKKSAAAQAAVNSSAPAVKEAVAKAQSADAKQVILDEVKARFEDALPLKIEKDDLEKDLPNLTPDQLKRLDELKKQEEVLDIDGAFKSAQELLMPLYKKDLALLDVQALQDKKELLEKSEIALKERFEVTQKQLATVTSSSDRNVIYKNALDIMLELVANKAQAEAVNELLKEKGEPVHS